MNSNVKIQKSIVLAKEHWEKLSEIAKEKYMSVNDVVRQAISDYIKARENASK